MALETDDSVVEPERMMIGCYAETHGAKTYEKGGHLDIHPDNASAYHSSTFIVPTVQTKHESLLATYSRCGLDEYGTPGSKMREVIERSTRDGALEVARSIYLRSAFEASGKSRQHLPTREDLDSVYGQNETVRDGIRPLTTRALSCLSHTVNWSKDSVDYIHDQFNTSICYQGTPSKTLGGITLDVSLMECEEMVSVGEIFIPNIAIPDLQISGASSSA
ncbi:hypothetical protein I316_04471 [Kwoniella heveanensis BCC8398]|uniref:Uncharacterized protein n=1 Tax=Kwoniella heveanensis BCC8398 TaxID=1296120 RepID=A0A1B9GRQ8_9TREE|nr:hypothetical protein I316_04471 [Kwoniella heveanensis BCC8398]